MGAAEKASSPTDAEVIAEACKLIEERTGVQLGAKQFDMAESRLRRRISDLGLAGFQEYHAWLQGNREQETEALVSLLTTHHTYFFREFSQFELLAEMLPKLVEQAKARGQNRLEIWSSACSRGQEVYSLAMHLKLHLAAVAPGFDFKIFGTDVDPESVKLASNGVYRRDEIKEVPMSYLGDHWARGSGEIADFVKAKKSIRNHCDFAVGNLMKLAELGARKYDVIFCRNVFIYFTPEQVKQVTRDLLARLQPGGFLAIGLSESLHGLGLQVKNLGPSVYGHREIRVESAPLPSMPKPVAVAQPLRVVCIDDSPTVLTLMKKILTKEFGFEVVGTAANGDDGHAAVERWKPDVVTLDIHMPVCGGIDYLKKYQKPGSPPVVMVTSVSRDDATLAQGALSLGASDFVEKPALNNLAERGAELRAKLKSAFSQKGAHRLASVDAEFSASVSAGDPSGKGRVVSVSESDLLRALPTLRDLGKSNVKCWVVVDSPEARLQPVRERLLAECGPSIRVIGVAEIGAVAGQRISVICFGAAPAWLSRLKAPRGLQVLTEDGVVAAGLPPGTVLDRMQATSFVYMSEGFLGAKG